MSVDANARMCHVWRSWLCMMDELAASSPSGSLIGTKFGCLLAANRLYTPSGVPDAVDSAKGIWSGGNGGGGSADGSAGDRVQHSSQPASAPLPSDAHEIVPSDATTPTGPLVPQYLTPLMVRKSNPQLL